ncbi:MAG: SBBP repeat-containing protein [Saprospiraceae bacterium]
MGGTGLDDISGVAIDNMLNVYVAGITASTANISTSNAFQKNFGGGGSDAFVAKFDQNGVRIWSTYSGGENIDAGFNNDISIGYSKIVVDNESNVIMSSTTSSLLNISSGGVDQELFGGGFLDGYLVKFDPDGNRLWSTYIGGTTSDYTGSLTTDQDNNIYIIGGSDSDTKISKNSVHQSVKSGLWDAFLLKYNKEGVKNWGTYYGGTGYDYGYVVMVDPDGGVYVSGYTSSSGGIATTNSHQATFAGSNDGFLARFSNLGNRQWGTYVGGTGPEYFYGLAWGIDEQIILSGMTGGSTTKISTAGAYQQDFGGGNFDGVIKKFKTNGVQSWGTYFGNSSNEGIISVTADLKGNIYFSGWTNGLESISTPGSHQATFAGGVQDIFVVKLKDETAGVSNPFTKKDSPRFFPNPTSEFLTFDQDHSTEIAFRIFDVQGNLQQGSSAGNGKISVKNLVSGLYYLVWKTAAMEGYRADSFIKME